MALFGGKSERDLVCAFVVGLPEQVNQLVFDSSRMDIIPIDLLLSRISWTMGLKQDMLRQEQTKDCKRIQSHPPQKTYEKALSAINAAALIIWQTTASVDGLTRREL